MKKVFELMGLIFDLIGAIILACSIKIEKSGAEFLMGETMLSLTATTVVKPIFIGGILFLIIGFILQIIGILKD